ncbi:MAG: hypothetical protein WCB73_19980 [Pseudonocardiaceae bacterium]
MSFVSRTPEGNYRANWREPSGQQKAKTFRTKTEAKRFLAEIDGSLSRGLYVDPHAGRCCSPHTPESGWTAATTS